MIEAIDIPLGKLRRRTDARRIIDNVIPALMESIQEVGVIHPLRVRPIEIFESGRPARGWQITAGGHRFEAASRLGLETVPCIVVEEDDLHAELAMIDENLRRANSSPAEDALAVKRRKEIYEELHPETKAEAFKGNRHTGSLAGDNLSFASETAKVTGKDRRTVERDAARGEALGDTLKDIAGTSLDKGVEMDALAKLPEPERRQLVARAARGEDVSAKSGIDRELTLEAAKNIASRLAEWCPPSEWEWLKSSLYTAKAKSVADAFVNETGAGAPVMDRRFG